MLKPTIFLIDDKLSNLIALEQHLESSEYEIEKYSTAIEALPRMLLAPPHCVLVDCQLPEMNGIEFTRIVKADPSLKDVPIILITGKIYSENQALAAVQAGAYEYLTKPLNPVLLKAKVSLLVDYARCKRYCQNQETSDS